MDTSKPDKVIPEKCIGFKLKPNISNTTYQKCILYALGLGYSKDPLNKNDLKYTYEFSEEFTSFPTYSTCINEINIFNLLTECPGLPEFNPMLLLHGQQRTIQKLPLKTDNHYYNLGSIYDVADKVKGALVTLKLETYEIKDNNINNWNESNLELAFVNYSSLFIRGIGGFGYKGKYDVPIIENLKVLPKGKYQVYQYKTEKDQAILYRLSGDYNPLHIDPSMASIAKFDRPILHGLCFYGISSKLIVENFLNFNEKDLESISATFVGHVFPGDLLEFKFIRINNKIYFEGCTIERKKTIIVGSAIVKGIPSL